MKKILVSLLSVLLILSLCVSGALCVIADDIYGTEAEGIVPTGGYKNHLIPPTDKFNNADFEQGLKYWTTVGGQPPSESVEILEEGGNHYLHFTATKEFEGVISPRFTVDSSMANKQLVVLYDWRGEADFQIYLAQRLFTADEKGGYYKDGYTDENRLSQGQGRVLKYAETDEEWNTSMATAVKPVVEPPADASQNLYMTVGVQVMTVPEIDAHIDNLRLAIYRDSEKKIYDLDGTTVLYDIEAIENAEEELEEEEETEEEEYEEEESEEEEEQDNTDKEVDTDADTDEDSDDTDSKGSLLTNPILWVSVGAGIVVIAAAVVVVLMILKKKKSATVTGEEDTSASEE